MRLVLTLLPLLALLAGCERTPPSGELIRSFGKYRSPDNRFTLKVEKTGDSGVVGTLLNSNGAVQFSEEIGSDAFRWCFQWSANGTLWAFSSDTGYLKQLTPKPDGSVDVRAVRRGTRIPCALYDFLPTSLRRSFLRRRGRPHPR